MHLWNSFQLHSRPVEAFVQVQERLWNQVLEDAGSDMPWSALFQALASSEAFKELWVGLRGPFLLPRLRCIEAVFKLDDIAEGLAIASRAGEKIPAAIGLMLPVPGMLDTHINSQLPPVTSKVDLEELMGFGTIFLNAASKHWRSLARICQDAGAAFAFPTNINIYATAPGRKISTLPHADHHDVLIMQSQGSKRWRVFAPPPRVFGKHPLHRGKGTDTLHKHELGPALIDVTLTPGESLFVPAGFPHSTSTTTGEGTEAPASVHLTLGLSAADCGLTYSTLVGQVLLEMGLEPPDDEVLTEESFWTMNRPLPLGCLSHLSHLSHGPNRKSGILQNLAAELSRVALGILSMTDLRTRDPSDEVLETVSLKKAVSVVASRWYDIWADLLQIHWEGYRDVVAAQAGGKVVATGLQGTSVFHALPRPCDDELFLNAEEGEVDPAILSATSSATKFCDFIRARLPTMELKWRDPVDPKELKKRTSILPSVFELVD